MKTAPPSRAEMVTSIRVIEGVFALHERLREDVSAVLQDHDLTPALADALWRLDPVNGAQSRRALAERLYCDPSNVTFLADRLEERGLVERVDDPADRRIKALVLTVAGAETRARLVRALVDALTAYGLSDREQRRLADLLSGVAARPGATGAARTRSA